MKKGKWILAILAAGCLAAGCGSAANTMMETESVSREASADYETYETADTAAALTDEAASGTVTDTTGIETPVNTSQKLIKTVTLNMETKEFDSLLSGIQDKVEETEGYTETSYISGNGYYETGNRSAQMTLRIPVDKLDGFVTTVSGLGNVTSKNESVEDITLQYVDTESHKQALETEQERLLALMEQADNVEDTIKIETRLSEIRYELQTYESTLRTYDNQVSYSTVYINLYEVERESSPQKQSFADEIKTRLSDNFYQIGSSLRGFAVWLVASLPYFAILAAVCFIVFRMIRKKMKKNKKNDKEERNGD